MYIYIYVYICICIYIYSDIYIYIYMIFAYMHTCAVCLQGTFFVHHEPAYLEILRDFLVEVAVGVPGALQHLLGLRQQRLSP